MKQNIPKQGCSKAKLIYLVLAACFCALPTLIFFLRGRDAVSEALLPLALGLVPLAAIPLLISLGLAMPRRKEADVKLTLLMIGPSVIISAAFSMIAIWSWFQGFHAAQLYLNFEQLSGISRSFYMTLVAILCCTRLDGLSSKKQHVSLAPLCLLTVLVSLQCIDLVTGLFTAELEMIGGFSAIIALFSAVLFLKASKEQSSPLLAALGIGALLLSLNHVLYFAHIFHNQASPLVLLLNVNELLSFYLVLPLMLKSGTGAELAVRAGTQQGLIDSARNEGSELILGRLSQELRTPLNAIVGLSEVLKNDLLTNNASSASQDVEKINEAAWQLVYMVDDLLELATLPRSAITPYETPFDAERFVAMLERMGQRLATPYLTSFAVHCPVGLGPILADENRLLQICMNLVRNALRYTRDGKIALHLYPSHEQGEARIQIDIRDNGRGMSVTELAAVYQAFAPSPPLASDDRLNLIMPSTRQLCSLLGARLHVESSPGLGTTCSVSFPDRLREQRLLQRLSFPDKRRALLIDSGMRGNEDILSLLSHQGVELCRVRKASSGLRVFFEMTPDFVIADGREWSAEKVAVLDTIRHRDPQCPIFLIHEKGQAESDVKRIRQEIEQLCRTRPQARA